VKVSGFSFIRNALKYDYPIVEAITSILPICDEFIIAVGKSEDTTLQLIESINSPKIKILPTTWDDTLRESGKVLAVETDKALQAVAQDSDWAFYIQGDEVVHEQYLDTIRQAMLQWKDNPEVEGLLFKYLHFYGSYKYIGDSRRWYRREVRIVRPRNDIFSYQDAQGFRKKPNNKLQVKLIDAYIYHYGWVKPPRLQFEKRMEFNRLWSPEDLSMDVHDFNYQDIDSLKTFVGTHPAVMQERYKRYDWDFEFDPKKAKVSLKDKWLHAFYKATGVWLFEYRNYRLI
jgi:hypothetical protein